MQIPANNYLFKVTIKTLENAAKYIQINIVIDVVLVFLLLITIHSCISTYTYVIKRQLNLRQNMATFIDIYLSLTSLHIYPNMGENLEQRGLSCALCN